MKYLTDLYNPYLDFDKYVYQNDMQDFQMPYKNAGKFDIEIMKEKYKNLSNEPKNYLHVRLNK